MVSQYLTAVFELRPSRRKAATMERVRASAEDVFWSIIGTLRTQADTIVAIEVAKDRRTAWRSLQADVARRVIADSARNGLNEPVGHGLVRDVQMAVGSYIESRVAAHDAEWPTRKTPVASVHDDTLTALMTATTKEQESEARDALALVARQPGPRGMTIARSRDALLVRKGATGGIAAVLQLLRASDPRTRVAKILPGIEAATGEMIEGGASKAKIVVPITCSKWHEQKFLSGKAILRSSLIIRRGERWFMCAQFEFNTIEAQLTGARLGVDRGVVNPVAMAVVRGDGSLVAVSEPLGGEIGRSISEADSRRRSEQKRRGITSHRHIGRVDDALHRLANGIIAEAKSRGAQVVFERLDGLKKTITEKRPKGTRKGGWRRVLKKAQLGKLEQVLAYKLAMAGLPPCREVVAGGTSQTCPACGQRDPKNRTSQEQFACVTCGFRAHADTIGAVNIARRGVAMQRIGKGDKLAPLEQDMVARLRSRDDGGLGPLQAGKVGSGFVAAHASAVEANEGLVPLTSAAGQEVTHGTENAGDRVFAERGATFSPNLQGESINGEQPLDR